jgi:aspartyl-tRNA(Asn)/glutamyl-tRNA(Gln) amidotransferase subunit B
MVAIMQRHASYRTRIDVASMPCFISKCRKSNRHLPTTSYIIHSAVTTSNSNRKNYCHNSTHRYFHSSSYLLWYVDPVTGGVTNKQYENQTELRKLQHLPIYQVMVGLEIHIQFNHCTTKLFSSARTAAASHSSETILPSSSSPNIVPYMHPYDVAVPGTLPVLSVQAVRYALLTAAVFNCQTINRSSRFERKHYMYADLPHGYQITQQRWPIAQNGYVQCERTTTPIAPSGKHNNDNNKQQQHRTTMTPNMLHCRINRIQLEQDTAKTTTNSTMDTWEDRRVTTMTTYSRVDMNRAGIALCEIVTEPDIRSSKDAGCMVRYIRQLLQYSQICSGQMQHGQLRVDCNVNVVPSNNRNSNNSNYNRQDGNVIVATKRHPRVEVKNLNSIKQVEDCIQYEAYRQVTELESKNQQGKKLYEETRTWNAVTNRTVLTRRKDSAQDYRFLPEPDLPPLIINDHVLNGCTTVQEYISKHLPELPDAIVQQFIDIGISDYQARVITNIPSAVPFFRAAVQYAISNPNSSEIPQQELVSSTNLSSCSSSTAIQTANLLCNVLFHLVKEHRELVKTSDNCYTIVDKNVDDDNEYSMDVSNVSARQLGEVVMLVQEELISNMMAKSLLKILYVKYPKSLVADKYISPRQVALERNMLLVSDTETLRNMCLTILQQHPEEIQVYQKGGRFVMKMENLFIGKVMKAASGNAHPERLRDIVTECLQEMAKQ